MITLTSRFKKISAIVLAQVILLVIVIIIVLGFLRASNEEQLQQHIDITSRLFNKAVKDAVLSMDLATLESIIEESVSDPDIIYMRITNNGITLSQGGDIQLFKHLQEPYHPDTELVDINDRVHNIYTKIVEGGITYGVLEIGLAKSSLEHISLKARQWFFTLLIFLIPLISAWVYLLRKSKKRLVQEISDKVKDTELAIANEEKRAAELVIATDQLVSQSRHVVMGEMIAMLTHQWKQPLTAMMMNVKAIKIKSKTIKMAEADEQFFKTRIEKIEAMMVDQNQLLTDFREFFRPDKKKNLFNIRTNIDSVLDMLKGLIVKYGITLKVDIPKKLEISGYDRELRHVMINLIKNAVDQLVEKTVKDPTIWIKTVVNDEILTITVEDNGGGIDESIITTLFEAYASTKSLNGTGLGLYMSKIIIQNHFKGSLTVANTEKGAKFAIAFKYEV